jgi:MOSC domain-containing protein YiiM
MKLLSINCSQVHDLWVRGRRQRSAIGKRGVQGAVAVGVLGLDGDSQADPRHHGGPRRAVYAYPSEHYAFWQTVRAQARVCLWEDELPHGFLGENLTLSGLLESELWVGDELTFPDVTLTVTEPREPCGKFNAVMGFSQASRLMIQSGWCGFYLAVKREGHLQAGQDFTLTPGPRHLRLSELFRMKFAQGTAGDSPRSAVPQSGDQDI